MRGRKGLPFFGRRPVASRVSHFCRLTAQQHGKFGDGIMLTDGGQFRVDNRGKFLFGATAWLLGIHALKVTPITTSAAN